MKLRETRWETWLGEERVLSYLGGARKFFNCVVMEASTSMFSKLWVPDQRCSLLFSMTKCLMSVKEMKRLKQKTTWSSSKALFHLVLWSQGEWRLTVKVTCLSARLITTLTDSPRLCLPSFYLLFRFPPHFPLSPVV